LSLTLAHALVAISPKTASELCIELWASVMFQKNRKVPWEKKP